MIHFERLLWEKGAKYVAGVDEVGRGCLAGPVMAAAVILPVPCNIEGINDSKKLSPKKREELSVLILEQALAFSFGLVSPEEIDRINILQATRKAMKLAVEGLAVKPCALLIDGNASIDVPVHQTRITGGDSKSISIAAASIIAKVKRDAMMRALKTQYPDFSFDIHKGYGTPAHLAEILKHGPTNIHRMTFARVR